MGRGTLKPKPRPKPARHRRPGIEELTLALELLGLESLTLQFDITSHSSSITGLDPYIETLHEQAYDYTLDYIRRYLMGPPPITRLRGELTLRVGIDQPELRRYS